MPGPKVLIYLDRLLRLPYKLLLPLFAGNSKRYVSSTDDKVVVIKMMGIGSITRIVRSLKTSNVDLDKTLFVTLASNADLCKVLGVTNTHFVNDKNLFTLVWGLFKLNILLRSQKPKHLINYERGSNILGLFQLISTVFCPTRIISFHDFEKDIITNKAAIYTIDKKNFQYLINKTIPFFKTTKRSDTPRMELVVNTKKVIININASDYMPYRKYSIEGFEKVIRALNQWDYTLSYDLIGSAEEKVYVDRLIRRISDLDATINNRCGQWSLSDLVTNLTDCAVLITNDSGPMHLGALVKIPMITIWGPTSSRYFGYKSPYIKNIQAYTDCSPCFLYAKSQGAKACNRRIDCMKEISPEEIFREAQRKLTNLDLFRMVDVAHVKHIKERSDFNLVS